MPTLIEIEPMTERSQLHSKVLAMLRHRRTTLTIADISDKCGVSQRYLWALLAEKINEPSALKLERLERFFASDAKRMKAHDI